MRRILHRHRSKSRIIVGLTLAIVGFLIIIYFIPIEWLLLSIGIALLIMGGLILKTK